MGYGVLSQRGDYGVTRKRGDMFLPALIGGIGLVKKGIGALKGAKGALSTLKGAKALRMGGKVAGGAATALTIGGAVSAVGGRRQNGGGGRRRRMNPANPKALKRAIRREQGFIKLARRTLKGTGFVITRRGMGGKRKAFGRK